MKRPHDSGSSSLIPRKFTECGSIGIALIADVLEIGRNSVAAPDCERSSTVSSKQYEFRSFHPQLCHSSGDAMLGGGLKLSMSNHTNMVSYHWIIRTSVISGMALMLIACSLMAYAPE
jgi:hypothetical protein